jgi:hypothetical protein
MIRLSAEKFVEQIKRVQFGEDGGAAVNLLFADGGRVFGRLIGDGLTFWTNNAIPKSEVIGIDEFVG